METISIVVLASSYKNHQRCIAGKKVIKTDDGTWSLSEDWIIDETKGWAFNGKFKADVVNRLIDNPDNIWVDPLTSIDKVSHNFTLSGHVEQSLYLVEPTELEFVLNNDMNPFDGVHKRKMTVRFNYNGARYTGITVTDPIILNKFRENYPEQDAGAVILNLEDSDNYKLCISLAPPFGSNHTQSKLLAAVIPSA